MLFFTKLITLFLDQEFQIQMLEYSCQREELNLRPRVYESLALPLSYAGIY